MILVGNLKITAPWIFYWEYCISKYSQNRGYHAEKLEIEDRKLWIAQDTIQWIMTEKLHLSNVGAAGYGGICIRKTICYVPTWDDANDEQLRTGTHPNLFFGGVQWLPGDPSWVWAWNLNSTCIIAREVILFFHKALNLAVCSQTNFKSHRKNPSIQSVILKM